MLFYVFITMTFIFSQKIGFNLPLLLSEKIAIIIPDSACPTADILYKNRHKIFICARKKVFPFGN